MVRYPFFAVHFLFCHTFLNLRQKQKDVKQNKPSKSLEICEDKFSSLSIYFENSPVTFLVKVAAALCAVLLVALRLVKAVGGARPHLRILEKDANFEGGGGGSAK